MAEHPTVHIDIDKLPEDSRFRFYLYKIPIELKRDPFIVFKYIFWDCVHFLKEVKKIAFPRAVLSLITSHEKYLALEQQLTKTAIVEEDTKVQSKAFVIHDQFRASLYVDVEVLINLLEQHGYPSFTLDLVRTYFHELLHTAYSDKNEQEIFDLECVLVEEFLGFEMPEECFGVHGNT